MEFPHLTSEKRREMTQVVRLPEIINMLSEWYVTSKVLTRAAWYRMSRLRSCLVQVKDSGRNITI